MDEEEKMNVEFEIKEILRNGHNIELKIQKICKMTTFNKEHVHEAILEGGSNVSDIYGNILKIQKKNV